MILTTYWQSTMSSSTIAATKLAVCMTFLAIWARVLARLATYIPSAAAAERSSIMYESLSTWQIDWWLRFVVSYQQSISLLFFSWSEVSTYFIFMTVLIKVAERQIDLSTETDKSSLQSSLAIFFTMKNLRSANNLSALIISNFVPVIVNILCRLREHSVHLPARAWIIKYALKPHLDDNSRIIALIIEAAIRQRTRFSILVVDMRTKFVQLMCFSITKVRSKKK